MALDKGPGVRPLGIGEIWKRGIAKCALKIVGEDAKAACGSTNLCIGLEAGIEGALHAVSARAADAQIIEFGEWEVDDDVFAQTPEEDEVQDSLPMRRAQATRDAAAEVVDENLRPRCTAGQRYRLMSRYSVMPRWRRLRWLQLPEPPRQ